MNCKQANESIRLSELMERLGYEVKKKERGNTEWRYLSPFRSEAEPSFYINTNQNCWFDHGEGEGSFSVVDFAQKYLQANGGGSSVQECLSWLVSLGFGNTQTRSFFPSEQQDNETFTPEPPKDLEFIRAKDVSHPAIFQYLKGRGISEPLITHYLKEVQYRNLKKNKVFFAFGIENRAGGFEIRSASDTPAFKSALIRRDISIIKGNPKKEEKILNVFEGTTDFLSLLSLLKTTRLNGDALLMHSLSSYSESIEFIQNETYSIVNLWLDNDTSGNKTTAKFIDDLDELTQDQSSRYTGYNDLNAYLKANLEKPQMFESFTPN